MKKICLTGIGLQSAAIAKALTEMPEVREFGYDSKTEAKKKKKRLRELARRQKRLDKLTQKQR